MAGRAPGDESGSAGGGGQGEHPLGGPVLERALRAEAEAAREQLNRVLAGITDQFLALDPDWRYVFVNDRVTEVTGKSREELLGRSLWDVFPGTVGSEFEHALRRAAAERSPVHFEFFYPPWNRWFENHVYPTASGLTLFVADITERKAAEEALRRSERQLRLVTDAMPALIAYVDGDRRYRFNNRAYTDWLGYAPAELEGRHLRDVLGEEVYEAVRPAVDAVFAGQTVSVEVTLPYRGGLPRHVHVSYIPDAAEEGEVRGYYALITDLSERKAAEERLRESEERLRVSEAKLQAALDGGRLGAWSWDPATGRTDCDRRVLELFGLDPATYRGQAGEVFERIHPDDRREVGAGLRRALRPGGEYYAEFRVRLPDGRQRWVAGAGRAQQSAEGGAIQVHGVNFDVTERKRAELNDRFLIELDTVLTQRDDPDEIERTAVGRLGAYLGVDRCYFAQIAGSRATVTGEYGQDGDSVLGAYDLEDYFTPETRERFAQGVATVIEDVAADPRTAAAAERFAALGLGALISVPVLYRERWVGALTCASRLPRQWRQDELHLLRNLAARAWPLIEQARAARALREADRRKDEFLAMLAHELRNPLAPIRSAAEVLRIADPADAGQRFAREVIERQAQHLARLVDDLLDVSRITRGKVTLQPEPLELAAVVERAVESSRPLIEARRHRLTVALPAEPVHLLGDPTRLVQVLDNLLNNAAKYTDERGNLAVEAAREGAAAVVRVRDDGMGIPADLLPHVFDLFTQSQRSLDRSQGGLGIGLTLVRQLVELHGGTVEAKSDGPGRGSEVVVRLPALPPATQMDAAAGPADLREPPPAAVRGLRVLLVEDNADAAEIMAFLLELSGHQVRTAPDGPAALEAARAFRPQVVLCDIGLPGMTGYELAEKLRAEPELAGARLVALTGYGQDEDRRRSREAGFDEHLIKPVEPAALTALLDGWREGG